MSQMPEAGRVEGRETRLLAVMGGAVDSLARKGRFGAVLEDDIHGHRWELRRRGLHNLLLKGHLLERVPAGINSQKSAL